MWWSLNRKPFNCWDYAFRALHEHREGYIVLVLTKLSRNKKESPEWVQFLFRWTFGLIGGIFLNIAMIGSYRRWLHAMYIAEDGKILSEYVPIERIPRRFPPPIFEGKISVKKDKDST